VALAVRTIEERDVEPAGDVNFLAFYHVALAHGVTPAVTSPADCRSYVRFLRTVDPLGGLVAEEDGVVVGMAWVHPRGPVATVGPIAVAPRAQGRGIGRRLLEGCIERAGAGVPQVRLVQESFNVASLGLYLRSGFRVVAPLVELERPGGAPLAPPAAPMGVVVRPATAADRSRLVARDARAFGAPRPENVDVYLGRGQALVAERGGALAGYALGIDLGRQAHLGSAAADDAEVLHLLVGTLAASLGARGAAVRTLVPATDRRLVDALVAIGFRVFRGCFFMVRGGGTAPPANYVPMNGDFI
jgi:GNAT superfamily N-acetyltransferase